MDRFNLDSNFVPDFSYLQELEEASFDPSVAFGSQPCMSGFSVQTLEPPSPAYVSQPDAVQNNAYSVNPLNQYVVGPSTLDSNFISGDNLADIPLDGLDRYSGPNETSSDELRYTELNAPTDISSPPQDESCGKTSVNFSQSSSRPVAIISPLNTGIQQQVTNATAEIERHESIVISEPLTITPGEASQKAYAQSEKRKASKQAWAQSEKGKAYQKAYAQSEKRKAYQKAYAQSEKRKASKQAWAQSEKGKASKQAWAQSEKGKASKQAWAQSEKGKAYAQSEKRKASKQAWAQSEKGKAYAQSEKRKAYAQSEKRKASKQAWAQSEKGKAYAQSEKRKAYQKAYAQSEKRKASKQAWAQSEKGKASKQAWAQSEKRKAYQKAYYEVLKNTGDREQARIAGKQATALIKESNIAKNNEVGSTSISPPPPPAFQS
ncbi:hypothetical protein [Endozoicomonas sp.]|uniref:hypothetical protein n=1 Tax=Endozoicomonas sp. TaxID=1892382 RepID=UPI003AF7C334